MYIVYHACKESQNDFAEPKMSKSYNCENILLIFNNIVCIYSSIDLQFIMKNS